LALAGALFLWLGLGMTGARADDASAGNPRIKIAYEPPQSREFQALYTLMKERRALERLRLFLAPFDLPADITIAVSDCRDEMGAWYDIDLKSLTGCYYFLDQVMKRAPKRTTPAGITRDGVVAGSITQVLLHEFGHAIVNLYDVPIFGNEEDVADQLAAYLILKLDKPEAKRLISGSAFMLAGYAAEEKVGAAALADDHRLAAQRFYSVVCLAFGKDPANFRLVEQRKILPKQRAELCPLEYQQVDHAFRVLVAPHLKPDSHFTFGPPPG
jgi:Putative metallopeptidase